MPCQEAEHGESKNKTKKVSIGGEFYNVQNFVAPTWLAQFNVKLAGFGTEQPTN